MITLANVHVAIVIYKTTTHRLPFLWCRFSLVKEHLIEFTQLAMANSEGSDDMLNRVMPKDNIGLAALLKTKEAAWDNGKNYVYVFAVKARSWLVL